MGRRQLLLIAFSLLALLSPASTTGNCLVSVCGELGNGGADISGTITTPGGTSGGSGAGERDGAGSSPGSGGDEGECADPVLINGIPKCASWDIPVGGPGEESSAADRPPVTLSEIEHFTPEPPRQRMQPEAWTVVGLHTNIYANASPHVVPGTLFGLPAEVRFTPRSYHWSYGDGRSAERTTPGGSWQSLGLAEFDKTPTSHIYSEQGEYLIRLSVDYTAEYRYNGSGWLPIAGVLELPANELAITVVDAQTVLVDEDCRTQPAGPGC